MSVYFYDEALVNKLNSWTKDTDLTVYGNSDTQRLFEVIADNSNDKPIKLPILCLRRVGGFTVVNTNKRPLTFDGLTHEANISKSLQINAIPIEISYQLDIYTKFFKEADEYARNLIFNLINYPLVTIEIPYNGESLQHDSVIQLSGDVQDNSSIPERLISGQFTRLSLSLKVTQAYLWDARVRNNYCIQESVVFDNSIKFDSDIKLK